MLTSANWKYVKNYYDYNHYTYIIIMYETLLHAQEYIYYVMHCRKGNFVEFNTLTESDVLYKSFKLIVIN